MGHLGLTPQSIYKFGTYVVRAKEEEEALLYRDMRNDMVQQLMRRLSAVNRLDAGAAPPVR